jgi:hypothetical protein
MLALRMGRSPLAERAVERVPAAHALGVEAEVVVGGVAVEVAPHLRRVEAAARVGHHLVGELLGRPHAVDGFEWRQPVGAATGERAEGEVAQPAIDRAAGDHAGGVELEPDVAGERFVGALAGEGRLAAGRAHGLGEAHHARRRGVEDRRLGGDDQLGKGVADIGRRHAHGV